MEMQEGETGENPGHAGDAEDFENVVGDILEMREFPAQCGREMCTGEHNVLLGIGTKTLEISKKSLCIMKILL